MPSLPKKVILPKASRRVGVPAGRTTTERGYGYRWQKLRDAWLKEEPRLCVDCLAEGFLIPAEHVDHVQPHRGDDRLLYDRGNLQGLCASHHSRKTARERIEMRK